MTFSFGPKTAQSDLVLNMDFSDPKCYPGSGSSCYDLVNNFQGTLVNSPTYQTSGNNKFLAFSGNRYIKIPNSTLLNSHDFSVEVWFKPTTLAQNGFLFEKGHVNTSYSLFLTASSSRIIWRHRSSTAYSLRDLPSFSTTIGVSTSNWNCLVGTKSSAGVKKIYVNSTLKNTQNDAAYTNVSISNNGMSIGAYGGWDGGRGYYYSGAIAVVKVYTRDLSGSEVAQNYNALKGRFGL